MPQRLAGIEKTFGRTTAAYVKMVLMGERDVLRRIPNVTEFADPQTLEAIYLPMVTYTDTLEFEPDHEEHQDGRELPGDSLWSRCRSERPLGRSAVGCEAGIGGSVTIATVSSNGADYLVGTPEQRRRAGHRRTYTCLRFPVDSARESD